MPECVSHLWSLFVSAMEETIRTPPSCHERQHPLAVSRQILKEDCSVKHKIAPSTKCTQTNEQAQHLPVRARACYDREDRADDQRHIERNLAPDHICANAPEQRTDQHAHVCGDGEAIGIAGLNSRAAWRAMMDWINRMRESTA